MGIIVVHGYDERTQMVRFFKNGATLMIKYNFSGIRLYVQGCQKKGAPMKKRVSYVKKLKGHTRGLYKCEQVSHIRCAQFSYSNRS